MDVIKNALNRVAYGIWNYGNTRGRYSTIASENNPKWMRAVKPLLDMGATHYTRDWKVLGKSVEIKIYHFENNEYILLNTFEIDVTPRTDNKIEDNSKSKKEKKQNSVNNLGQNPEFKKLDELNFENKSNDIKK